MLLAKGGRMPGHSRNRDVLTTVRWMTTVAAESCGPSVLAAPPYEYSFVSSPAIDPDYIDAVMPAFFDAIENDQTLPNVIQLKFLDGAHG